MALSTFAHGRLWGARYGRGKPWVLALHGWGRDHHDFDAVLTGTDAVALDLPGHGVAPEPPGPWSTSEYARWVAPALDEMGEGPVVVVGHSFGARVAVWLAAGLDGTGLDGKGASGTGAGGTGLDGKGASGTGTVVGRIAALVLVGAPLAPAPGQDGRRPPLVYRAGRALHRAGLVSGDRMERLRQKHGSEDYRRASEMMRGVLVKAVAETASAAYVPAVRSWATAGGAVELVWGQHDKVASLPGLKAALEGLQPTAPVRITVVPEAGHLLTPPVAAEVRAALLRHQPPGAP
jgi:pimeloyl-ACP methyl ester carboxylesterase